MSFLWVKRFNYIYFNIFVLKIFAILYFSASWIVENYFTSSKWFYDLNFFIHWSLDPLIFCFICLLRQYYHSQIRMDPLKYSTADFSSVLRIYFYLPKIFELSKLENATLDHGYLNLLHSEATISAENSKAREKESKITHCCAFAESITYDAFEGT